MRTTTTTLIFVLFVKLLKAQFIGDQSLIAYYPFDGNGNDLSPNQFNATLVGPSTYVTDRNGEENKAFSFNGSSNYF